MNMGQRSNCVLPSILIPLLLVLITDAQEPITCDDPRIQHQFVVIDYDWENDTCRDIALNTSTYIPENNIISGLRVYEDEVYVTVPRWRLGVPSTLNKVLKVNGTSILQPFPNWEMQTIGDCRALQYVQSMEIDPNTGWMWIIDAGRINLFATNGTEILNPCQAKIVIYDINKMEEVTRYEFPDDIVNHTASFLNDIVVQYTEKGARYAYISDTIASRLVVYDRTLNTSYFFTDTTTLPEPGKGNITVSGETLVGSLGINGIALSPDMQYLYFSPGSSYGLFQIPTNVTSDPDGNFAKFVRRVGDKPAHGAGMVFSKKNVLYFGALEDISIYTWDVKQNCKTQGVGYSNVTLKTINKNYHTNDTCMVFADILTIDQDGFLWFVINKLHKFLLQTMDFSGQSGPNALIWKIYVGTTSYIDRRSPTCK